MFWENRYEILTEGFVEFPTHLGKLSVFFELMTLNLLMK